MIKLIINDFCQPVSYIPVGLAAAGFCTVVVYGVQIAMQKTVRKTGGRIRTARGAGRSPRLFSRPVLFFLLFFYLYIVLETAFFSRPPGSRTGVDLTVGATWGASLQSRAYVIENVLLTIPLGCLFPMVWKRMQKCRWTVFAAFLLSTSLEGMQLVTGRGHCQVDDVLTNTLGALIGWLFWKIAAGRRKGIEITGGPSA